MQIEFSIPVRKDVTIGLTRELGLDRPIPEGSRPEEDWQRPVRMTLAYRDERGHETTVTEWDERIIWGKGMGVETLVRSIESAATRDAAFQFGGECVYVLTFHGKDHPHKSRLFFKIPGGQETAHLARTAGIGDSAKAKEESSIAERLMPEVLRYVQGKEEQLQQYGKLLFETLLRSNQGYAAVIQEYTDRETKLREIELSASDHAYEQQKRRQKEQDDAQMKKDAWEMVKNNGPKLVPHLISALQRFSGGQGLSPVQLRQLQAWGEQQQVASEKANGKQAQAQAQAQTPSNGVKTAKGSKTSVGVDAEIVEERAASNGAAGAAPEAGADASAGASSERKQLELRIALDLTRLVMLVRGRGHEQAIREVLSEEQRSFWDDVVKAAEASAVDEASVEKAARLALEFGGAVQADPSVGFKLLSILDDFSKIALVELSKILEAYQAELAKDAGAAGAAKEEGG